MKLELNLVDGVCRGFNLVAEDATEQHMLEMVRGMCTVECKRNEKIQFTGVTRDHRANVSRVIFIQRYIANMPDSHRVKRALHKAVLSRKT